MDHYEVQLARSVWDKILAARSKLVLDGDIHKAVDDLTDALAEMENLMGDYKPCGGRELETSAEEPEHFITEEMAALGLEKVFKREGRDAPSGAGATTLAPREDES